MRKKLIRVLEVLLDLVVIGIFLALVGSVILGVAMYAAGLR